MREQIWADGQFKAWGPPASAPMQKRPRGPTELRLKQLSQGTSRSLEGVQSSGTHGLVHPGARSPVAGVQVGGTQPLPSPDRSAPWSSHSFFPPLNPPTPTVHGWPLLMGQPPSGVLPPRTTPQICMPPPSASPLVLLPPSPSRGGAPRALAPTGLPAHPSASFDEGGISSLRLVFRHGICDTGGTHSRQARGQCSLLLY